MITDENQKQRIVVVGGGPGGYEAALAGAQLGADVTLVERQGMGGAAVLTDVVPSKALIATADAAEALRQATELGIEFIAEGNRVTPEVTVDLAAINRRLLALAEAQSRDMLENLLQAGVRVVIGSGRLDGNHTVVVDSLEDGATETLPAQTIVIATGARPRSLPNAEPDGDRILNWTQLYQLERLPEHLIVVGSGVTGAEFASAFRSLGSAVTLVSSREMVLPGEDQDAAIVIDRVFRQNGMEVLNRSRAERVENLGWGVRVSLADGRVIEGSHCLMAVGSIPNTEGIGLVEAGIETTESGHIRVNKVARTSRANVYAAGDCTDFLPLASVSAMQGRTAIFHTMGDISVPTQLRNVSSNVFTSPEIASVGWSQRDIEAGIAQGTIYKVMLGSNPRAKMQRLEEGFIKLFARTGSGTVIGGVIVAPKASELIYSIAIAVENRLTVDELARTFTVYPSLAGSISDAARALHNPGI